MEYYSAIKKNNAICSNMDKPRDCHTEWSTQTSENALMASSSLEPTKETYQFPQGSPGDVSMH